MKYLFSTILGLSLVLGFGFDSLWSTAPEKVDGFTDRVNLALRQVGHQLRTINGDTQSPIPPVEVISSHRFELLIQDAFNYDTLPFLIQQAFDSYHIASEYQVVVNRCQDETIVLGFNQQAVERGEVACKGREQVSDCNNIVVSFAPPGSSSDKSRLLLWASLLLVGVVGTGYFFGKSDRTGPTQEGISRPEQPGMMSPSTSSLAIGNFKFDHQNQTLQLGEDKQDLTFRESKLLHHLVMHKNEIQSREVLIDQVWADEGVLVGRSLDVFISRLRKLLKADDQVAIKTIHGVGYRLEVAV